MDQNQFIAVVEHCISRVARGDVPNIDVSMVPDGSIRVGIHGPETTEPVTLAVQEDNGQ